MEERRSRYSPSGYTHHDWQKDIITIGTIPAAEIMRPLPMGALNEDVAVQVNKRLFDYDRVIIVGRCSPTSDRRLFGRQQCISSPAWPGRT